MSLSAAIATFVTLDVALLGLLAFVMSRAARLTPHGPATSVRRHDEAHLREQTARRPLQVGVLGAS